MNILTQMSFVSSSEFSCLIMSTAEGSGEVVLMMAMLEGPLPRPKDMLCLTADIGAAEPGSCSLHQRYL